MSIIKGTNQIVAGFGGTKRSIGEVYFSQSSLATDNSGALPLFTGETIASANTIYPDFYNWVLAHTELQCTSAEYESALSTYGECPKYVISDGTSNTVGWPFEKNKIIYTTNPNLTITIGSYNSSEGFSEAENYKLLYSDTSNISDSYVQLYIDEELTKPAYLKYVVTGSNTTTTTYRALFIKLFNSKVTLYYNYNNAFSIVYDHTTDTTVTAGVPLQLDIDSYIPLSLESGSIRLPKLSNYIKAANTAEGITQKEAGLPDHTHYLATSITSGTWGGGEYLSKDGSTGGDGSYTLMGTSNEIPSIFKSSEASNTIYGKSSTVTPASTTLYPWVVAYTAVIPASEAQAAEFQQGLSGKADTNLGNVPSNYDYVVESYHDADGNWYRKYKSGWLEQGGVVDVNANSQYSGNLLKPVNNYLTTTFIATDNGSALNANVYGFQQGCGLSSNTTFFLRTAYDGMIKVSWYACGSGAEE